MSLRKYPLTMSMRCKGSYFRVLFLGIWILRIIPWQLAFGFVKTVLMSSSQPWKVIGTLSLTEFCKFKFAEIVTRHYTTSKHGCFTIKYNLSFITLFAIDHIFRLYMHQGGFPSLENNFAQLQFWACTKTRNDRNETTGTTGTKPPEPPERPNKNRKWPEPPKPKSNTIRTKYRAYILS